MIYILVSLDNAAENCKLDVYPAAIHHHAAVKYMDSLGAVVACGGENLDDSSKCFAYDSSGWTPLPDSPQRHCWLDSLTLIVSQGMWVAGLLQEYDDLYNGCSDEWSSEIFTGEEWIEGPPHPNTYATYGCLAEVNATHSLIVGGLQDNSQVSDTWLYDWTSGVWTGPIILNEGRFAHACAKLEGQGVLVAGGFDKFGSYIYSVELFDPETGVWTTQPSLPEDVYVGGPDLHPTSSGSVIAIFNKRDEVYERAEDGTWSALEGVALPERTGEDSRNYRAAIVPADFAGCM